VESHDMHMDVGSWTWCLVVWWTVRSVAGGRGALRELTLRTDRQTTAVALCALFCAGLTCYPFERHKPMRPQPSPLNSDNSVSEHECAGQVAALSTHLLNGPIVSCSRRRFRGPRGA